MQRKSVGVEFANALQIDEEEEEQQEQEAGEEEEGK